MKILISGASGLVGSALMPWLQAHGHQAVPLRRAPSDPPGQAASWDPTHDRLILREPFDAVVHLAGENVAGRWTKAKKDRIVRSRVDGTKLLSCGLADLQPPPQVFISASAVGYYGDRGAEWLTEESQAGDDFLAHTARAWEQAADPLRAVGTRVVHFRLGMVLSSRGGALARLLTPFRFGLGGRVGQGNQYWAWVAIDDVVAAVAHALETVNLQGPINVVAPQAVTCAEFTRTLAGVLKRPMLFPLPETAVRVLLGQMGEEMLLASTRVKPERLLEAGFHFEYPELDGALRHLLVHSNQTKDW